METPEKPLYTSKQVEAKVEIYDRRDERFIQDERLAARIMILNRNQRLGIRDYNQTFNNPERR